MEYKVVGGNLPAVLCRLCPGESVLCEGGAMSWMTDTFEMTTEGGGLGKVFGRMLTGESAFRNRYTARSEGEIGFSSCFPGEIRAVEINPGHAVIAQKKSFLASSSGVDMSVFFQQKLSGGFLGGEGFIMQKFSGSGVVFVEIDGSAVEYFLAPGEKKVISTGHLVMMDDTCTMTAETVKGLKNKLFGGEGFFNTVVTGPGRIVLQTMPIAKTAQALYALMPHPTSSNN